MAFVELLVFRYRASMSPVGFTMARCRSIRIFEQVLLLSVYVLLMVMKASGRNSASADVPRLKCALWGFGLTLSVCWIPYAHWRTSHFVEVPGIWSPMWTQTMLSSHLKKSPRNCPYSRH